MRIFVNNIELQLKPGTKIRFTLKNTIFHQEGSTTFPFNLPPVYSNRKALGFPSRLSIGSKTKMYDCTIDVKGHVFQGAIYVLSSTDSEIRVSILLNDTLYIRDGKKAINELNYDYIQLPSTDADAETYFNSDDVLGFPSADSKFCLPEFVKTDSTSGFAAANQYVFWDVHAQGVDAVPGIQYPESNIMPQFYLRYVFNQFISDHEYKLVANDMWENFDLQCLFILGAGSIRYSPTSTYRRIYPGEHLPAISFIEMMERIKHTFGAVLFRNHFNRDVKVKFLKDILRSPAGVDLSDKAIITDVNVESKMDGVIFSHPFSETDDFWKDNVKDIRKEIVKGEYTSTADVVSDNHLDGDILLIEEYPGAQFAAYYIYHPGASEEFEFYCYKYEAYQEGNTEDNTEKWEQQITGPITLPWNFDYNYHRYFISPQFVTPEDKRKEFSLRLLFYRGKQMGGMTPVDPHYPNGIRIPMASNDVYDYLGGKLMEANQALRNDGEYGLIENFWKDWINWTLNRRVPVKAVIHQNIEDILQLDFSEPIRIDTENYIINQLDFEINTDDNIEFVNADLERL